MPQANYPSIKTLLPLCDKSQGDPRETARKIRQAMTCTRETLLEQFPRAAAVRNHCYNEPSTVQLRLEVIDELLGTHGVEYIPRGHNAKSPAIEYCNTGDTYASTVMYVNGRFIVGCWGNFVEQGDYD